MRVSTHQWQVVAAKISGEPLVFLGALSRRWQSDFCGETADYTGWSTNDATRSMKHACEKCRKNIIEFLLHQKFELTPFIHDTTLDPAYQVEKDPFQHGLRDFFDDLRDIGFKFCESARMIDVHFLFDVAPQEEVVRCQIRWPGWPQIAGNEPIIEEGT